MNILVPDSWLREYLKTDASPKQLKDCLSLCGPSIERINTVDGETVYDIEITTNRIDMGSIYGIAREGAAILPRFNIKAELQPIAVGAGSPSPTSQAGGETPPLPLSIEDPDYLCHRILAIVMDTVTVTSAPTQMKDRIEKSGVRSLNNLIDITNYVMLELGHPCHVFDYDRIGTGKLHLRKAKKGEKMITLDDKEYTLSDQDIIIDDGTGRVIDLPGIMGTANSVVTDNTKRIIVFIESNDPVAIRRSSMRHGIRSYAAGINEKHPDPELAKTVMLRAIGLYQELAGGKPASELIDVYPKPHQIKPITVSVPFINERLGVTLAEKEIVSILRSLSFTVETKDLSLQVIPPSFRQFDVAIPEDIVEEVARIYGYYKLPGQLMTGEIPVSEKSPQLALEQTIKHRVRDWGYTETYTYSFIAKHLIEKAGLSPEDHVKVANPLTEEITHMRRSLLPSLLTVMEKNQHLREAISLFELSNVYLPRKNDLPEEVSQLQFLTTQSYAALKGMIEQLLENIGITTVTFKRSVDTTLLHPNKQAVITSGDIRLGTIGAVHPSLSDAFHLKQENMTATLDIGTLTAHAKSHKRFIPIPSYPAVQEDYSLDLPEKTEIGMVIQAIRAADPVVVSATLMDQYQHTVTIRVIYQNPEKNLTGEDTKKLRESILTSLEKQFGIKLKA